MHWRHQRSGVQVVCLHAYGGPSSPGTAGSVLGVNPPYLPRMQNMSDGLMGRSNIRTKTSPSSSSDGMSLSTTLMLAEGSSSLYLAITAAFCLPMLETAYAKFTKCALRMTERVSCAFCCVPQLLALNCNTIYSSETSKGSFSCLLQKRLHADLRQAFGAITGSTSRFERKEDLHPGNFSRHVARWCKTILIMRWNTVSP